jgi:hypothetical protein
MTTGQSDDANYHHTATVRKRKICRRRKKKSLQISGG